LKRYNNRKSYYTSNTFRSPPILRPVPPTPQVAIAVDCTNGAVTTGRSQGIAAAAYAHGGGGASGQDIARSRDAATATSPPPPTAHTALPPAAAKRAKSPEWSHSATISR
jgi:hypothetical protein